MKKRQYSNDPRTGFFPHEGGANRYSRRNSFRKTRETNNRKGISRVMVISAPGIQGLTKITTRKQYLKDRVIIHRD